MGELRDRLAEALREHVSASPPPVVSPFENCNRNCLAIVAEAAALAWLREQFTVMADAMSRLGSNGKAGLGMCGWDDRAIAAIDALVEQAQRKE